MYTRQKPLNLAAVELAREIFGGSLETTSALIYGAGRMAELTIEEKDRISHRGRALRKLTQQLEEHLA